MESIGRTVFVRAAASLRNDEEASGQSPLEISDARVRTFVFLARHGAHALLGVPQKTMIQTTTIVKQVGE